MQQYERRLQDLRQIMQQDGLSGFLVPRADEFQGEYVPAHRQRLGWLTGFTGSAGIAAIGQERAALFVDGRYTLQAAQQVDGRLYQICHSAEQSLSGWLRQHCRPGERFGFDPWLHSEQSIGRLQDACRMAGAELVAVEENLVDRMWSDRPSPPCGPLRLHDEDHAGRSSRDKRREIAAMLAGDGQDCVLLSDPASVAWLLNVRADDVPHLPVPLCFAVLHADGGMDLFVDGDRVPPDVRQVLGDDIRYYGASTLPDRLTQLGQQGRRVRLDGGQAPFACGDLLRRAGAAVALAVDPSALPRSVKNAVELAGCHAAHRRDALAMVRFLIWFGQQEHLDELGAARQMDALRRANPLCRDLSFATIAGGGPNGAIVHYQVDAQSNRALQPGDLFLLDSGGQYVDGTTDITRTLAFAPAVVPPSSLMRRHYTLVLKGHIALSRAVFPAGTTGPQLDCLARQFLWQDHLDYDHGTGHGVGSYLSVHEGPQRISKLGDRAVALQAGMILSIEPGCYRTGDYGIRLENLAEVVALPTHGGDSRQWLGFQPLTLVPFDVALLEPDLLTTDECLWLREYHQRICVTLADDLADDERTWLQTIAEFYEDSPRWRNLAQ